MLTITGITKIRLIKEMIIVTSRDLE
jgi:hypothetical protein